MRIYLKPTCDDKGKDLGSFMFLDKDGDEWPIERTSFAGIYLKESYIDHNYGWFLENNESDLHFP